MFSQVYCAIHLRTCETASPPGAEMAEPGKLPGLQGRSEVRLTTRKLVLIGKGVKAEV